MTPREVGLLDEDLQRFERAQRFAVFDAVTELGFQGLAVVAPTAIDLASASPALPAVVVSAVDALEHWRVEVPASVVVLAVATDGSATFSASLHPPQAQHTEENDPGPPPEGNDATAVYTEAIHADVRARLELPWCEGELDLYAVAFDRRSEPARVRLEGTGEYARSQCMAPLRANRGQTAHSPPFDGALTFELHDGYLYVAAPGPSLVVLRVIRRRPEHSLFAFDLEGQPWADFALADLVPMGGSAEAVCFYLVSGGRVGGPIPAADDRVSHPSDR